MNKHRVQLLRIHSGLSPCLPVSGTAAKSNTSGNNDYFTSAENHKAVAMGKANMGSLENGKKVIKLDQQAPSILDLP